MQYREANNQYFEKSANGYDKATRIIAQWRIKLFEVANAQPGNKILDVATGTGAVALTFAKNGFTTVGIDLSPDMLSVADSKKENLPVTFLLCDATTLPFDTHSFDIVTVSFALHDMPPAIRANVLCEINRVLSPGGKFVIMDYGTPANFLWRKLSYAIINSYEELNFREFIASDFRQLLSQRGFQIDTETHLLGGVARLLVCGKK